MSFSLCYVGVGLEDSSRHESNHWRYECQHCILTSSAKTFVVVLKDKLFHICQYNGLAQRQAFPHLSLTVVIGPARLPLVHKISNIHSQERDCMISHGAAKFLKERLFDVSDAFRLHCCDNCGLFATADLERHVYECRLCKSKGAVSMITLPYACKLLFQELMTMSVAPRLSLKIDC